MALTSRVQSWLIVALLLIAATASASAQGQGEASQNTTSSGGNARPDDAGKPDQTGRPDQTNPTAENNAAAGGSGRPTSPGKSEERAPATATGRFEVAHQDQHVTGDYVSFDYADDGISNFTVGGHLLFSATVAPALDAVAKGTRVKTHGATFDIETTNYSLSAHDNPVIATHLDTAGSVRLQFPAHATFDFVNNERARFHVGDLQGQVRGSALTLDGAALSSADNVFIVLDTPRAAFDIHRSAISEAVATRQVGAEATFNVADDGTVAQDIVSYGTVNVRTISAKSGNLTVEIDGEGIDGRVVVLNVDGRIVAAAHTDKVTITLDGQTLAPANDITDILNPDDDGLVPEYYLVRDASMDDFQLLVSLPHYSVHTLSLVLPTVLPPPSVVLGFVLGTLLIVPAAFALFRPSKSGRR